MKNVKCIFLVILLNCVCIGCKKDNSIESLHYDGIWTGLFSTRIVSPTGIYILINQTDNDSITGYYQTLNLTWGYISGIVNGENLSFKLEQKCVISNNIETTGTFSGTGEMKDDHLLIKFSGSDNSGTHTNGQGDFLNQNEPLTDCVTTYVVGTQIYYEFESETESPKITVFNIDRSMWGIEGFEQLAEFSDSGNKYYIRCYGIYRDTHGIPLYYLSNFIASIDGEIKEGTIIP